MVSAQAVRGEALAVIASLVVSGCSFARVPAHDSSRDLCFRPDVRARDIESVTLPKGAD
jgi:hypothetical protein